MKVSRAAALPRKSNLAMAQDAATPKTTFKGTLMMTAIKERQLDSRQSVLVTERLPILGQPLGEGLHKKHLIRGRKE